MNTKQKKVISTLILLLFFLFYREPINHYEEIRPVPNPNHLLALVNKYYQLPWDYFPTPLMLISSHYAYEEKYVRLEARDAFEKLSEDARKLGLHIIAVSAYRSYQYQTNLYQHYVETKGTKDADRCSARPGHSEHQTGLAIDVMGDNLDYNLFADTMEFIWMQENAHRYGFILRYPKNKEHITGFKYEPWHYRYVGVLDATEIYNKQLTLEEYIFDKKMKK